MIKALDILLAVHMERHGTFRQITILLPPNKKVPFRLNHIKSRNIGFFQGHLWEQIFLPMFSFRGLLVNLCNTAPVLSGNKIVVIHDASVFAMPHCFSLGFRIFYTLLWTTLAKVSRKILTDSQFSQKEIARYCRKNPQDILVIPCGREHIVRLEADYSIIDKHQLKKGEYILSVSSMDPRKNFKGLLKAIERIKEHDFDIVIAGGQNARIFKEGAFSNHSGKIKTIGYVSDEALKALYEHAGCFVYPSLYEGFGLPPLEAMTCGCPVILARSSSLPEVGGDSVLYCDPRDPGDIARKIELLMADKDLRKKYSQMGLKQAQLFSWEKTARDYFELIQKADSDVRGNRV